MKNTLNISGLHKNTEPMIEFQQVTKKYWIEREQKLKRGLLQVFQQRSPTSFSALRAVSLQIFPRETIGLVGPNGAGKTTILRLIARIAFPTTGKVLVKGRVAPLIELGAGFHQDFSGRENIYLNGVILGMTRQEIDKKFTNILAFAGKSVEKFIDTPVKKYSLGMRARLGFSIAIHTDPDILLVDESVSVGDAAFQKQCVKKLRELKNAGKTIVMTSHNQLFLDSFCTRIVRVENGTILS